MNAVKVPQSGMNFSNPIRDGRVEPWAWGVPRASRGRRAIVTQTDQAMLRLSSAGEAEGEQEKAC